MAIVPQLSEEVVVLKSGLTGLIGNYWGYLTFLFVNPADPAGWVPGCFCG
jgi:hypothetical protein